MATSINVNKQSVKELLSSGAVHKFIIPEYQRPYAWTEEQVETLFSDLWNFTEKNDPTYFLGSIVSYINDKNEQEIIDGQQRITSLFLLLRAIYTKLTATPSDKKEVINFISEIEPTLWVKDNLTGEVKDFGNILLESKVVNNSGNEILKNILKTGTTDEKAKDNYSVNYRKFQELYNKASQDSPLQIFQFIYNILNKAILLPITADTQDTALTIFSTLNNRGLPLSDADIFKATIYNHLTPDQKKTFIEGWQELEEDALNTDESIQSLFYYYMFYLRGLEGDDSSTTPGIRNYFIKEHKNKLYDTELLSKLNDILNIWKVVTNRESIQDEAWTVDKEILKTLDILSSYPNEFWKYPVVTYYLSHKKENNFIYNFRLFLNRLMAELVIKYVLIPSINAVKSDIMKLNVASIQSVHPTFNFKEAENKALLDDLIKKTNSKNIRMLLKIITYLHQEELLPPKWEIEHIFPQKWHSNYFENISDDIIKEKIEYLGNKVPFEKKLNIQAGNGYFLKKKEDYAKSDIVITKELANDEYQDWDLESITERGIKVCQEIKSALNKWICDYSGEAKTQEPTPEELEILKKYQGYKITN